MDQPAAALTHDEKRTIATEYQALRDAIDGGLAEDDVAVRAMSFQRAYRGPSRPIVDAFGAADDKRDWAQQVSARLSEEIGPAYWLPTEQGAATDDTGADATPSEAAAAARVDADVDELVVVTTQCDRCGEALQVRCAPLPGAALVTHHALSCPACGQLTQQDLPGAVVVDILAIGAARDVFVTEPRTDVAAEQS